MLILQDTLQQEQCRFHINSTDRSTTGHSANQAGPPSNRDRKNIQHDAVLNTPDRSSPNLKNTPNDQTTKQQNPHRTEAKNKVSQYCFSSALPPPGKGRAHSKQYLPSLWNQDHKQLNSSIPNSLHAAWAKILFFWGGRARTRNYYYSKNIMKWQTGRLGP